MKTFTLQTKFDGSNLIGAFKSCIYAVFHAQTIFSSRLFVCLVWKSILIRMWFAIGCALASHPSCSPFFPPIFSPFFSPPSFSLKANVWLRALIYAKLPPRWFNPITFDECYLPSSRHRTSLLAYLFVPTGPGLATLFFLPRLFSKLNVEAVADLWYMLTSPPALICNPDLHW